MYSEERSMEDLLKKVRDGSVSSEELATLLHKLGSKDIPEELQPLLSEYWNNASASDDEIDKELLWHDILEKTGNIRPVVNENIADRNTNLRIIKRVLSYAAVFVIAIGLSWLIFNITGRNAATENDQYTRVEVSYGSKTRIELPDGSHVTLNSGSFIRYPNSFRRNNNEIYFEGEVYFDIKKDKSRPFVVKTSDVKIQVLGTQFNVKAYPEEKNIETTLIRGEVEVSYKNATSDKNEKILLQPNHKLIIQKTVSKPTSSDSNIPDTQNVSRESANPAVEYVSKPELLTSWKDNKLVFNNEPFEELIKRFERWYDVSIIINDKDIKQARLSGQFEKETIEQALDALTMTVPFKYTIDKNIITIYPALTYN